MRIPISISFAFLVLAVPSCFAQTLMSRPAGSVHFDKDGNLVTATFNYRVPLQPPVLGFLPGRPYSAEEVSQQTQILPDGTRIVRSSPSNFFYRDSAGRVRTERHAIRPVEIVNWVESPVVPEICDPIAGFLYYLDPVNRIAHRMLLPRESIRFAPALRRETYPASSTKEADAIRASEPLGTKMIDGIEVQGRRMTTTYAAGAVGNDRPIVAITEVWTSPELGLTVYSKNTDPRTGDFINPVLNISRAEPDPALFQIPAAYRIVDEQKVPFTFTISITGAAKY